MSYIDNIKSEIHYRALVCFNVNRNLAQIKNFNDLMCHVDFIYKMHIISEKTYNELIEMIELERRMYKIPYEW